MEDIAPSLFTPEPAGGMAAAGIRAGIRNRSCDVTCEHCGVAYHLTRYRPKRAKRRLCINCRGTAAAAIVHAKFVTPESSKAERIRANGLVNKRLKLGWFEKPAACMACGDHHRRISGHHADYRKPDHVLWLCPGCHIRSHIIPGAFDHIEPFVCFDRRHARPSPREGAQS